ALPARGDRPRVLRGDGRAVVRGRTRQYRIASRMRQAVVGFVDGPRDAVVEADQVLEELAAQFTDAVDRRRRTLRGSWQSGSEGGKDRSATAAATATDTEQLRLALRDYRELTERLLHL
ncbi:hypothetical protein AB0L81_44290, partial [Streptomyces sp. NPDC052127]